MFNVGDKVICTNDAIDFDKKEEIRSDIPNWIQKDEEYTIREILDNDGIVTGVLLEEVRNFPKYFQLIDRIQEPGFATWRFRKLQYATNQAYELKEKEYETMGV